MKLKPREKWIISLSVFYVFLITAIVTTIGNVYVYTVEISPLYFLAYTSGVFLPAIVLFGIAKHLEKKLEINS